jgi:hypothetical protein
MNQERSMLSLHGWYTFFEQYFKQRLLMRQKQPLSFENEQQWRYLVMLIDEACLPKQKIC